jgi:hypothetical protein
MSLSSDNNSISNWNSDNDSDNNGDNSIYDVTESDNNSSNNDDSYDSDDSDYSNSDDNDGSDNNDNNENDENDDDSGDSDNYDSSDCYDYNYDYNYGYNYDYDYLSNKINDESYFGQPIYVTNNDITRKLILKKYNNKIRLLNNINLLTLECNEKVEQLPQYLEQLIITDIYPHTCPKLGHNLHTLHINGECCKTLPSNLDQYKLIRLVINYNKSIYINSLPLTLKHLELNCRIKGKLPKLSDTILFFMSPKHYAHKIYYPKELHTLLINNSSSVYTTYKLPENLNSLYIKNNVLAYNEKLILPPNLKKLKIYDNNHIKKIILPKFIEYIYIKTDIDEIDFDVKPHTIKKFYAPKCTNIIKN